MKPTGAHCVRESGFSLIEVLVAVLILAVGVLGVAGLQLVSLQNNTSALYRTQAFQAAYDIIDRARANPDQSYAIGMAASAPSIGTNCSTDICSPSALRDWDLDRWLASVSGNLPSGDGSVTLSSDVMTVTLQWQDSRAPAAAPFSVTVSTEI